jgi:hypothetical protein
MEIKPQAVVMPKETDHLEKGKYGPIFPRTPACYGFTIIAETLGSGLERSVKEAGTHRGRSLLLNIAVMSGENRDSE